MPWFWWSHLEVGSSFLRRTFVMPEMGFCVRWEMLTRLTLYPARQRAGSALQPAGPGLSGKSNRFVGRSLDLLWKWKMCSSESGAGFNGRANNLILILRHVQTTKKWLRLLLICYRPRIYAAIESRPRSVEVAARIIIAEWRSAEQSDPELLWE